MERLCENELIFPFEDSHIKKLNALVSATKSPDHGSSGDALDAFGLNRRRAAEVGQRRHKARRSGRFTIGRDQAVRSHNVGVKIYLEYMYPT